MWSSNFFADVLFDWENEINKRTEVTFFVIASAETEQLQSKKCLLNPQLNLLRLLHRNREHLAESSLSVC